MAEYVHILADSVLVEPGDRVAAGQRLCESGGAGFCPSPHLHLQVQEDEGGSAPTVLFALLNGKGEPYFPIAGTWYGPDGVAVAPTECQGRALADSTVSGGDERARGIDLDGAVDCGKGCEATLRLATRSPPPSR